MGGGPPYIRSNESLREGFFDILSGAISEVCKINIYVKRFDPRNFEKPNITLPRLETDVRSTHSALFPKILKAIYFKRFDACNFEAPISQIPRLETNTRTSHMALIPKIFPKK